MAPNLLVPIMKANPLSWFPKHSAKTPTLHYQHEPVPGIYHITSKGYRWLVAIKSNSKRDIGQIFVATIGFNETLRPLSTSSSTTWSSNATQVSSTRDGIESPNKSRRSVTFTTSKSEYHVHSKDNPPPCSLETLSLIFNQKRASKYCKVDPEDCFGGYKRLANPLKAKYNNVLKRWMFVAEINARTCIVDMCASETCMSKLHQRCGSDEECNKSCGSKCGTVVEREIFALDDGRSWVITGDVKKGGAVKKRRNVSVNCTLYCLNEWAGVRRQTPSEAENSIWRLFKHEGRFFSGDGEEEYVDVMDYLRI